MLKTDISIKSHATTESDGGEHHHLDWGSVKGFPFTKASKKRLPLSDVVEEFLSNFPQQIRKIIGELRKMVRGVMPAAHEFLYYDAINYSVDNSPLGRICYISPEPARVTVGFLFGARLDDLHHLLEGGGKRARHVRIRTMDEAKNSALKELMKAAWKHGAEPVQK